MASFYRVMLALISFYGGEEVFSPVRALGYHHYCTPRVTMLMLIIVLVYGHHGGVALSITSLPLKLAHHLLFP